MCNTCDSLSTHASNHESLCSVSTKQHILTRMELFSKGFFFHPSLLQTPAMLNPAQKLALQKKMASEIIDDIII